MIKRDFFLTGEAVLPLLKVFYKTRRQSVFQTEINPTSALSEYCIKILH